VKSAASGTTTPADGDDPHHDKQDGQDQPVRQPTHRGLLASSLFLEGITQAEGRDDLIPEG
jgi:hypothetical protein